MFTDEAQSNEQTLKTIFRWTSDVVLMHALLVYSYVHYYPVVIKVYLHGNSTAEQVCPHVIGKPRILTNSFHLTCYSTIPGNDNSWLLRQRDFGLAGILVLTSNLNICVLFCKLKTGVFLAEPNRPEVAPTEIIGWVKQCEFLFPNEIHAVAFLFDWFGFFRPNAKIFVLWIGSVKLERGVESRNVCFPKFSHGSLCPHRPTKDNDLHVVQARVGCGWR